MRSEEGAAIAPLTTMRVGGPADAMVTATSADEIAAAVAEVDTAGHDLLVLSGGSNLVVSDDGFPGVVLRIASRGVTVTAERGDTVEVTVAAGEPWDELVALAVERGWSGIEALSGIPGLTGATPVQNVGAYGQEVAQTISSVRVFDRAKGEIVTFRGENCDFTYRHSRFKGTSRYVVLEVTFTLVVADESAPVAYADLARQLGVELGERVPLAAAREAVLAQRRARGMVLDERDHDTWSCGSFFTNPILSPAEYDTVVERVGERLGPDAPVPPRFDGPQGSVKTSAAWLIDRAGFGKGYGMPGPAALSTKHTLAITNRGSATSEDIATLAREVRDGVRAAFGVTLVNEPVFVGHEL